MPDNPTQYVPPWKSQTESSENTESVITQQPAKEESNPPSSSSNASQIGVGLKIFFLVSGVVLFFPIFIVLALVSFGGIFSGLITNEIQDSSGHLILAAGFASVVFISLIPLSILVYAAFRWKWVPIIVVILSIISISLTTYSISVYGKAIESNKSEKLIQLKQMFTVYRPSYIPDQITFSGEGYYEGQIVTVYGYKLRELEDTPKGELVSTSIKVSQGHREDVINFYNECYTMVASKRCKGYEEIKAAGKPATYNQDENDQRQYVYTELEKSVILFETTKEVPKDALIKFAESFSPEK